MVCNACLPTARRDIYGGDYQSLGLDANMTACFFGKFVARGGGEKGDGSSALVREGVRDEDVCHALMLMVTNNIGQIAYLLARLHSIQHIFFSGTFLRHSSDPIAAIALSKAIAFWSGGAMKAMFLRHEGYFGALGAFLSQQQQQQQQAD